MKDLKIRWRLHGEEWEPTTRQRGINVYRQLQSMGYDADKWQVGEPADIIVLQYGMRLLDEALATGATVVADINDQLFAEHHPYYQETMAGMKRVQAVVAGSPWLYWHLQRMHPFVRMIEEAVDQRYFEVTRQKHKGINIIYMGMHDNIVYFDEIDDVLERLSHEFDFTLHFVLPALDGMKRSNADKVKAKPYPAEFHEWSMETLLEQMGSADIALAPLFHNSWAWGKCCNKVASFSAAGIPVVASDIPSYRAIMHHGSDVFLSYTQDDWYENLRSLLEDQKLRHRMGNAARVNVLKNLTIEQIAEEWIGLFEEIRPR